MPSFHQWLSGKLPERTTSNLTWTHKILPSLIS
ncbi:hypothetical protein LMG9673_03223 [Ralstonia pseudosolanacearum]|nr:hypothetical protein LMG9673_03223 [Ralstonia pseudosolanacearum]